MTIVQPRDPNHPLYRLVDDILLKGDLKMIAVDLEVTYGVVSRVKCGKQRSARIWKELIKTALKRKKDQDELMQILSGTKQVAA